MTNVITFPRQTMEERNKEIGSVVKKERNRLFNFIRRKVNNTEDAEDILKSREQGNLGGISFLLNLTHGILGEGLGIQVICTFNCHLSKVDQAALAHQKVPGHQRERGEDAGVVRRGHLRAHRHRQETASTRRLALHLSTDLVGLRFRENPAFMALQVNSADSDMPTSANQLNLFNI